MDVIKEEAVLFEQGASNTAGVSGVCDSVEGPHLFFNICARILFDNKW